jgi:ribosome maturation factor RimP
VSAVDTQLEAVRTAVEPAVAALGCALYDVELTGGSKARTLRVTVTRPEGVDLETITSVTRAVSPIVDHEAEIPGAFTLEVSSPGIERALRRPEHYASAVGEQVSVKYHTADGPRRVHGALTAVDDQRCVVETATGAREEIVLADVTQARTVFEWGPSPRPGKGKAKAKSGSTSRARAKGQA